MSYDPSHRMPPRQERWPHATPAEGWPSYRDAEEERADRRSGADRLDAHPAAAGHRGQVSQGSAVATAAFPATANGYRYGAAGDYGAAGYGEARDGYGRAASGYAEDVTGYDWAADGYAGTADGYAGTQDGFAGGAYLGPGSYTESGLAGPMPVAGPMLTAPDAGVYPDGWRAEQEFRREAGQRGPMVGAVTELLATGVVIGVSTLAAALLRSPVSPVSAMGTVFVDRMPAALRNAAVQHAGTHGRTVLLLGMFAAFAVVAIVIGVLARRAAAAGVAGVAAFTLLAAFAVITLPAGHVGDITPAVIGGVAGVAALLWLFRASAPIAPLRHTRGGTRRRAQ